MSIAEVATVISVVSSAAQVIGAVQGAQEAKRAKRAREQQSALEKSIRERKLRAEQRRKTADLFNRAAFTGAGTSSVFDSAVKSLKTAGAREIQVSNTLAGIERGQIKSDFNRDIINSLTTGFTGLATGATALDSAFESEETQE
jgi:hypothetical protein